MLLQLLYLFVLSGFYLQTQATQAARVFSVNKQIRLDFFKKREREKAHRSVEGKEYRNMVASERLRSLSCWSAVNLLVSNR